MLLGNWDGGMFPGQPCRQKAIVHRSHGCSPRASHLPGQGQSRAAHPRPQEVARLVAEEHGAPTCRTPSSTPKIMGCSILGCRAKAAPRHHPLPHPPDSSSQNMSSPSQGTGEEHAGLKWVNQTLPQPSWGDRQGHVPTGAGRSGRAGQGWLPRHGRSVPA